MTSWANIAKVEATPSAVPDLSSTPLDARIAVVDANAIIDGLRLDLVADKYYTISEVFNEIRDKRSKQFLTTLPYQLEVREPSEDSVKAVLRFARETGDVHALSAADVKLLALAHTLELAAHGTQHLREHPVQARTRSKHSGAGRKLPGWGSVTNPQDWKVVDEVPDNVLTSGTGSSRIIGALQGLSVADSAEAGQQVGPDGTPALPQPVAPNGQSTAPSHADEATGPCPTEDYDDEDDEDDEEDDGWATAGKSRNSVRRRKRNQERYDARVLARQQAAAAQAQAASQPQPSTSRPAAGVPAQQAQQPSSQLQPMQQQAAHKPAAWGGAGLSSSNAQQASVQQAGPASRPRDDGESSQFDDAESEPDLDDADHPAEAHADADQSPAKGGDDHLQDEEDDQSQDDEEDDDDSDDQEGEEGDTDEEHPDGEDAFIAGPSEDLDDITTVGEGATTDCASELGAPSEAAVNTTSSVISITGDFAMQNVLLQMGLRLLTRDGKQITRLSRWALRCSACFTVSREVGRVFCPRCGNMTMERVEVTVGPNGAEYFGVRKKHVLRGTRYSLPKPKGGRGASNPILREDVMMMKMGKKIRRKQRKAADQAAGEPEVDPFAPEFGADTWFQGQHAAGAGGKGGAVMVTSWRNNPNERKPERSNRRG